MTRNLLFSGLSVSLLAGCADLLGVETLSGDDAGSDAAGASGEAAGCNAGWVDASAGYVPPGAVPNKPLGEGGIAIFVCHAQSGSDVIPGKLLPNYGCYYGDGTKELLTRDYQVLVPIGCAVDWIPSPTGVVQAGAVACGQDSQGTFYSCRVEQADRDVGELGHMGWGTNHQCVYSLSGYSLTADVFDVLTQP
jgi:hypothetical protein